MFVEEIEIRSSQLLLLLKAEMYKKLSCRRKAHDEVQLTQHWDGKLVVAFALP
jgi:hypothetical protein